ncbi:MAG: hypothetical protein QOK29_190 [Rhodospirillaceae bacterium]|jgi:hypothetical protein|nr:hypothetical protein [Rhodospirillaceae bacterium]
MAERHGAAKTTRPSKGDEQQKIARLRDLRLAAQAGREQAGTWGDISVGEITHRATGAVFVHCWKGRAEPDLEKIHQTRGLDRTADEHQRLKDWLLKHRTQGFDCALLGWNLSPTEASRVKQARISEHNALGHSVVNELAKST